jgi:two-component system chemotaxis response regulator CheB
MQGHDLIVIGSSAGGVESLTRLCGGLRPDLPASILIAQHVSPSARSVLPELLARAGPLPAKHPQDGEKLHHGVIYIAPPDLHMLVDDGHVVLRRGPYENRTRPAINPLFRSAAVNGGSRVVGVVLSGMLDDGAAGLIAIKRCGGISVVQDPEDALWPEMPRNAVAQDSPDYVIKLAEMPKLLVKLARQASGPRVSVPESLSLEAKIAAQEVAMSGDVAKIGDPTVISCPQCGGVLNEVASAGSTRFRCQVGHAFTSEGLSAAQSDELERALFTAERMYVDRAVLFRRMLDHARTQAMPHAALRWQQGMEQAERSARLIRDAIESLRKNTD